jgi:hypothetical protein
VSRKSGPLTAGSPTLRIELVGGREQLDVGPDLRVGPDGDGRRVEEHGAEVDECTVADADVIAVVAVKRRPDPNPIADRAQQFVQDPRALLRRRRVGAVVRGAQRDAPRRVGREVRIVGDIPLTGEHAPLVVPHEIRTIPARPTQSA